MENRRVESQEKEFPAISKPRATCTLRNRRESSHDVGSEALLSRQDLRSLLQFFQLLDRWDQEKMH
jgi:hypothetical protein